MKTAIQLLSVLLFVTISPAFTSDFLQEYQRLQKSGDDSAMQSFLETSAETERENPDYYATAGNYWWQLSQSISVTTKPSGSDDFSVQDPKSGAEVGSISTLGQTNPEIPKKALDILTEGARRFPQRADISLGLAHVQRAMGLQNEYVDTLQRLLAFSRKSPEALLWTGNAPLPSAAENFIPEAIQSYSAGLYRAETPESDAFCAKLCDATIAAFPEHPFAYNIKAALATAHGEKEQALRYLQTAESKAPEDPLILLNLGDAYRDAGDVAKARGVYTKVLALEGVDESLRSQVLELLKQLEGSGSHEPQQSTAD